MRGGTCCSPGAGVRPYWNGVLGALRAAHLASTRTEDRLKLDPDWVSDSVQRDRNVAYRFIEGYASAQFRWGLIKSARSTATGGRRRSCLSVSNYGYPRTDLSFERVRRRPLSHLWPTAGRGGYRW